MAVQILYDGHHYLITIVYIKGVLHLYDNVSKGRLTAMLKESITAHFGSILKTKVLTINCPSVQQQKERSMNCMWCVCSSLCLPYCKR